MAPKFHIPLPNPNNGRIPNPHVSEEDFGGKCVVFKFKNYNHSCCEIARFEKGDARQFVKTLGEVNSIAAENLMTSRKAKPVKNTGNYATIYRGLAPDINLLEIDYTAAGRIFGFLVRNEFNIVAICKGHIKY